jgi:preprotein translocase subunit SecG
MFYVLLVLYVLVSLLLLVVVLLQQGKGGDIAAAFGGASSQTAFGARAGATVLTRATAVLGALFLLGAFVLTLMGRNQGGSVVSGVGAPAPAQTAPALPMPSTGPGTPAPATTPAAPTATPPADSPKPAQ